jgi:hypothetical protein
LLSTKKGDTVLDCFTGTSTTGIFALAYKRNFTGFEVNPQFIKASEINLKWLEHYNIINPNLRTDDFINLPPASGIDKIEPASPELKASFRSFAKAYDECFHAIQQIR